METAGKEARQVPIGAVRLAGTSVLCAVVLATAVAAGVHSSSHHQDTHTCPVCLHMQSASGWVAQPPPAPAPEPWEPLVEPAAATAAACALITAHSRGPPSSLL